MYVFTPYMDPMGMSGSKDGEVPVESIVGNRTRSTDTVPALIHRRPSPWGRSCNWLEQPTATVDISTRRNLVIEFIKASLEV